jgi:hypothetical protein
MASPAQKRATYSDLRDVSAHLVGEIIDGVLRTSPRPATRHARAASVLGGELEPPFSRGRGGPGGWSILDKPELHLSLLERQPSTATRTSVLSASHDAR